MRYPADTQKARSFFFPPITTSSPVVFLPFILVQIPVMNRSHLSYSSSPLYRLLTNFLCACGALLSYGQVLRVSISAILQLEVQLVRFRFFRPISPRMVSSSDALLPDVSSSHLPRAITSSGISSRKGKRDCTTLGTSTPMTGYESSRSHRNPPHGRCGLRPTLWTPDNRECQTDRGRDPVHCEAGEDN